MSIGAILSAVFDGTAGFIQPVRAAARVPSRSSPAAAAVTLSASAEDRVDLSAAAQASTSDAGATDARGTSDAAGANGRSERAAGGHQTPSAQTAQIQKLKRRDAEVRQHEAAHLAAAGAYARGGAHFEYQTGPDGHAYAVGGEVSIDTSAIPNDPAATITKMETIRAAALAPADPSSQDYKVAAEAMAVIQQAQSEQSQRGTAEGAESRADEAQSQDSSTDEAARTQRGGVSTARDSTVTPTSGSTGDTTMAKAVGAAGLSMNAALPASARHYRSAAHTNSAHLIDMIA